MSKYSSQTPTETSPDLPDVAKSAGYLAEWLLDRPVSAEAEAAAETVSNYLRGLADEQAAFRATLGEDGGLFDEAKRNTVCPAWCVVDHTGQYEEYVRECSTGGEEIPTLTHRTVSASVVQSTDFLSGTRRQPEVRVGDDTLTPVNAITYAEQIRDAAISALAPTLIGTEKPTGRCASWCVVDHENGSAELHESPITTIDGFRDADMTDVKFRANLRVESFESDEGPDERPVVWLDIEPVDRPTVNDADADSLPPVAVRHLAARALSGTERGQAVDLPPAVAVMLGRALVQYGEMAERA